MQSIIFPENPTINETFVVDGSTWRWDGTSWVSSSIFNGRFPSGATEQRPTDPKIGMIRYNTSLNIFEGYDGSEWKILSFDLIRRPVGISPAANEEIETNTTFTLVASDYVSFVGLNHASSDWQIASDLTFADPIINNIQDTTNLTSYDGDVIFATGGNVTEIEDNGVTYRVHTFTESGTFEVLEDNLEVDYLIVGGGGGGGAAFNTGRSGGGGGAGGLVFRQKETLSISEYPIVVGAGGVSIINQDAQNGEDSSFNNIIGIGGGGGAWGQSGTNRAGKAGGSGGGGQNAGGGAGTQPSSPSGGFGSNGIGNVNAGPGGGAGGIGSSEDGGSGGAGRDYSDFFGTSVGENGFFAGGGAGGRSGGSDGIGGIGGGGDAGQTNGSPGSDGLASTGGGGGGASRLNFNQNSSVIGGNGGSGVVIVRYAIPTIGITVPETGILYWRVRYRDSEGNESNWSIPQTFDSVEPPPDTLGQSYGGGFYIGTTCANSTEYYLIVAPNATGCAICQWKTTPTTTAFTSSFTDGFSNTYGPLDNAEHPAGNWTATRTINGFSDWYLPAIDEMNVLYVNDGGSTNTTLPDGEGFAAGGYWSSTEGSITAACSQSFGVGGQFCFYKTNSNRVRAVRREPI